MCNLKKFGSFLDYNEMIAPMLYLIWQMISLKNSLVSCKLHTMKFHCQLCWWKLLWLLNFTKLNEDVHQLCVKNLAFIMHTGYGKTLRRKNFLPTNYLYFIFSCERVVFPLIGLVCSIWRLNLLIDEFLMKSICVFSAVELFSLNLLLL